MGGGHCRAQVNLEGPARARNAQQHTFEQAGPFCRAREVTLQLGTAPGRRRLAGVGRAWSCTAPWGPAGGAGPSL